MSHEARIRVKVRLSCVKYSRQIIYGNSQSKILSSDCWITLSHHVHMDLTHVWTVQVPILVHREDIASLSINIELNCHLFPCTDQARLLQIFLTGRRSGKYAGHSETRTPKQRNQSFMYRWRCTEAVYCLNQKLKPYWQWTKKSKKSSNTCPKAD